MAPAPEDEAIHHPVAFIGIGSKNEQEMQQLIIEDKVRSFTLYYILHSLASLQEQQQQ